MAHTHKLLLLSIFCFSSQLQEVLSRCENNCNGHGDCSGTNQCDCQRGYSGVDCGDRNCPTGRAFIDSPAGDLNYDNKIGVDTIRQASVTTQPSSEQYFADYGSARMAHLMSEDWDEAHHNAECSNKGFCDKLTGTCTCFAGYTGAACQRVYCPNDCSGHGICKTYFGSEYKLWDAEKSAYCQCDTGFEGPSCNQRQCPMWVDPREEGTFDVSSMIRIGFKAFKNVPYVNASKLPLGKFHFTISIRDQYGDQWTTKAIELRYMDQKLSDFSTNANILAVPTLQRKDEFSKETHVSHLVKSYLEELPNKASGVLQVHEVYTALIDKTTTSLTFGKKFDVSSGSDIDSFYCDKEGWSSSSTNTDCKTKGLIGCGISLFDVATAGARNGDYDYDKFVSNTCSTNKVLLVNEANTWASSSSQKIVTHTNGGSKAIGQAYYQYPRYINNGGASLEEQANAYKVRMPRFTKSQELNGNFLINDEVDGNVINGLNLFIRFEKPYFPADTIRIDYFFSNEKPLNGDDIITTEVYEGTCSTKDCKTKNANGIVNIKDMTSLRRWDSEYFPQSLSYTTVDPTSKERSIKNHVCGRRGLCDPSTGMCSCFAGYTGTACQTQNALAGSDS